MRHNFIDWKLLFNYAQKELDELIINGIEIYVDNKLRKFKIRIVEFVADSVARNELLMMVAPTGYNSCPICTIKVI